MKCVGTVYVGLLLVGLSCSYVLPPAVEGGFEQDTKPAYKNNDTLVFAHVIYRHGEILTTNKQLTNEGKRQLYILGQYFRRRYGKIIGEKYSPDKVYVLSTDYDRSIMSAQANLAGLYYPTEDELWHADIKWQPVPVHTIPVDQDIILHIERPCPRYDELYRYYMRDSPQAKEAVEKYGHLFPYWEKMSGKKIKSLHNVFIIYKNLFTDQVQSKLMQDWELEAVKPNGPMEYIAKLVYKLRGTPELVRVRSGFLLKEMLERFNAKINSTLQPDRTLWIYSGHSSTLTTLLNGLGFAEQNIPKNGASFQFELYKTVDNKHYLQMYLRQPDEEYPSPMEIPGCGEKCPLDQFYSIYEQLIPNDYETECKLPEV